ncbi:hypothetical protein FACS1894140_4680 [Spirochaetia bacterium]|nr:hypothetical protein FACS1894140_4680 [Spirochaetia bacterium]
MNELDVITKMTGYIHISTRLLSDWLGPVLPKLTKNWWENCVLNTLSDEQRNRVLDKGNKSLKELDLSALLRITDRNWYAIRNVLFVSQVERNALQDMFHVRNNWAHCAGVLPERSVIEQDLQSIKEFFIQFNASSENKQSVLNFVTEVKNLDVSVSTLQLPIQQIAKKEIVNEQTDNAIKEKSLVCLKSNPTAKGMVSSISEINGTKKYEVFIDNEIKIFYEDQIYLANIPAAYHSVDVDFLRSSLTAYQVRNPSASSLYSLNSARIDFVPYQFRPALKIIKSDVPRMLIADSVGVGKTIEAGLVLKEMQARNDMEKILIICPRPLVAERKWEMEMKRFDEDFTTINNGSMLKQIIKETDIDGEWPDKYNKLIIPSSLLRNENILGQEKDKKKKEKRPILGLLDLDPAPYFDMVIVDEAHHIRNSTTKEYATVKYFCDHAEAVLFLTATPLQTGDKDLFTLLNVLRPDVILDYDTFLKMTEPNANINKAVHFLRTGTENYAVDTNAALQEAINTQWGQSVIAPNPTYKKAVTILSTKTITREQRVQLISDIEGLHSFSSIINRTRRQDIEDFCIRHSFTIESAFTERQKELHDALLEFVATA